MTDIKTEVEAGVSTPDTTASETADPRRWAAFIIMTVATFMDMLDGSIVNVALPTIQTDLSAAGFELQWISGSYALVFALLLITGGRLGDMFGRRRVFQIGVAAFVLASLLCGLATNPETLIVARILQGAAAGLMVPQVLAIVHVTFPDREKATVYAIYGTVGGIAATTAPLIGGLLVGWDLFGLDWRPIFLVNVPIGIVGLFLGFKFIPESKASEGSSLDIGGVALATLTLLALLVPLTVGHELGWPTWTFASMAVAVIGLIWFIAVERRQENSGRMALVPPSLFKARSFSAALALALACFTFTGMVMLALYMFMQAGLGWSPMHAGLTMLSFAIGAFVTASASVIVLVPKFGRAVVQAGTVLVAIGLLILWFTNQRSGGDVSSWTLAPGLFITGLGFGAAATPISLFALADVPMREAGSASGLINTMLQLGFAVGIAGAALTFFSPLDSAHGTGALETFSNALGITLLTGVGLAVVAFACASGLPRQVAQPEGH